MAKSANLNARIEPQVKEEAESILNALGISASSAITMFYKQVILRNGLPFEVTLPRRPLDADKLTDAQMNVELERGYADMLQSKTVPMELVFDAIRRENGE